VWNLSGSVTLRVTATAGPNAVVSGLFFGTGSTSGSTATYVKTDTTTQGTWKGAYGTDGFDIAEGSSPDVLSLPSYATVAVSGQSNYPWLFSTTDVRALQQPSSSSRVAATWYAATTFSIDIHITDGQTHQMALYAMDWDNQGRAETVQVVDDLTGTVLDTRTLSGFQGGQYLVWNLSGSVTLRVTATAGPNAVVSGLFFN
jgi:hypothetical protein